MGDNRASGSMPTLKSSLSWEQVAEYLNGSVEQVAEKFELGVVSKWLKRFTEEYGASSCAVKFVVDGSKRLYAMSKRLYE